jgi:3-oxoacyl-[acyl-carrier-protein] synthase-3
LITFFLNEDGTPFGRPNDIIISLKESGIEHRRYAETDQNSSDLAFLASEKRLPLQVLILKQSIILFCSQLGDVKAGTTQSDMLPSLATRVKTNYKKKMCSLRHPFGCPGWMKVFYKQMLLSNLAWQSVA